MNKVILLGNLTRDVEVQYSQNGLAIGRSAIAVNRKAKGKNGEMKDETTFIDFTVFGNAAETIPKYFRRGSKILIEGRLQFDQWTDQNGGKRSKHSILVESFYFPESKASAQQNNQNSYNNSSFNNNQPQGGYQNQQNSGNNWNNGDTPNRNNQNFGSQQSNSEKQKEEVPSIDINGDMDGNVPF